MLILNLQYFGGRGAKSSKGGSGSASTSSGSSREVVFTNHFGDRSHAEIVEKLPKGVTERNYQGEMNGFEIYSRQNLITSAYDYIAIKKKRR
jgi:hypothetical protein